MPERERHSILSELDPAFTVRQPDSHTTPFVVCSPHSGRIYTRHFLAQSRLDALTLRRSEDCYVDELFGHVADLGAPLLAALFPRAYLDVNREPYELDPELFGRKLPDWANTQSVRVIGGLGTIARVVADGEEIYPRRRLDLGIALERIERLYKPFHATLADLLGQTKARFGFAVLLDCHSMPSMSSGRSPMPRPDFVLGDRYGSACDGRLTGLVRDTLVELGYDVQLNRPYAGGYITEHYGRPARGLHALQIEINRGLYMDEQTLLPKPSLVGLERALALVSKTVFEAFPAVMEQRSAAE